VVILFPRKKPTKAALSNQQAFEKAPKKIGAKNIFGNHRGC
jgi:hypothetical protein